VLRIPLGDWLSRIPNWKEMKGTKDMNNCHSRSMITYERRWFL
jgi:hypothetical protein